MRCLRCEAQNREGRRFCAACGAALPVACRACGFPNDPAERFCGGCGVPLTEAGPPRPTAPAASAGSAERRQITVMFCDLVDSTSVSERLDPEEFRDIVREYQGACDGVIRRFGGHVAQFLGDGLLVYFGYPQAHEDDAERAVRAGLGIVETIARLNGAPRWDPTVRLAVRVGIHTGLVVVGQVGGSDRQEQLALGETPNIAARLQALAGSDTVLIGAATYRLIHRAFRCADLGARSLKGVTKPVHVYQALEPSSAVSAIASGEGETLTPLVGREQEVGLLLERWELARDGQGQFVLLHGEPGIGKSRLLEVVKERIAVEPHVRLESRCSPFYEHSPLYPMVDLLPRVLQWQREDTVAAKVDKLEQALSRLRVSLPEVVPLLASLLSVPAPDRYPAPPMSPALQKRKTLEALLQMLLAMAADVPVLLVMEDLHWVDPTTVELLELLVEQTPTARVLTVLAARPSFRPDWGTRSHVTTLTLNRFTRRQTEAMVGHLAGGKRLPDEVLHEIVVKTDGVPLFVEELTKMVLESGLLREEAERYELRGPLPPLAIPATLQDSLTARLDRLSTVREVAQLGATLGRAFSYELLRAVATVEDAALQDELERLVDAEILYQRGVLPQATYVFKHALIQEAAYQSLLKSARQQHHLRIAGTLVERFPEIAEHQPELVAHHYAEAGVGERAVAYWQQAGQRALQRSANLEAIAHLSKGLNVIKSLPDTPGRMRQELALQMTLGVPLMATKGYAAPPVEQAYARARELCECLGETPQLFPVLRGLWTFSLVRGELEPAARLCDQLLRLAGQSTDPGITLEAHFSAGATLLWRGHFADSRPHWEQVLALYDAQSHGSHALLYGLDPKVGSLSYGARTLWMLGYPEQALATAGEAISIAERIEHPFSLASARFFLALLHQHRREPAAALEHANEVVRIAAEQAFALWLGGATVLRGWAMAEQGRIEAGIAEMDRGFATYQTTGAQLGQSWILAMHAEERLRHHQPRDALTILDQALALVVKNDEHFYEPELHRLKGEAWLSYHAADQSESSACFRRALEVARRQRAKSLELRAATSAARLLDRQGKRDEGRALVSEVYAWFTEGHDTPDLTAARKFLDE